MHHFRASIQAFALLALIAHGCFVSPSAVAQSDGAPVVAILDVERIKRDSLAARSIREAFDAATRNLEADVRKRTEVLKGEEEQLRRQQTILAPEAFQERRRSLEQRYAELRRLVQENGSRLTNARNRASRNLEKALNELLREAMKENSISMILARKNVLVFDERMNITEDILKQLNAQLPRVEVDFDNPE